MTIYGTPNVLSDKIIQLNKDKIYVAEIKEKRQKRTLDQNAYYWQLVGQFAEWGKTSKLKLHREIIANYSVAVKDTFTLKPIEYDYLEEKRKIYYRALGKFYTDKNGKDYQWHCEVKGTSEMNTEEFANIIEGLINEIKGSNAPIETMTPRDLEILKQNSKEKNHENINQSDKVKTSSSG